MNDNNSSWSEYSRLVLTELTRLNDGISSIESEIQFLKKEISELQIKEDRVLELKTWKNQIDDIMSPSQLKEISKTVDGLKTFKTQAVTVWLVVQIIFGVIMALMRYIKI